MYVCMSLIFLANNLCVHVRKSDEMYASLTWCTHAKKKKNATEVTVKIYAYVSGIWLLMFLPKESSHKFAVFIFVNVMHFWG